MPDDPNRAIERAPEASTPEKPTTPPAITTPLAEPEPDLDLEADKTDMSAVGDDGQVFGG